MDSLSLLKSGHYSACSWYTQSLVGVCFARGVQQHWFTLQTTSGTVHVFCGRHTCCSRAHSTCSTFLDHGDLAVGYGIFLLFVFSQQCAERSLTTARVVRSLSMASSSLVSAQSWVGRCAHSNVGNEAPGPSCFWPYTQVQGRGVPHQGGVGWRRRPGAVSRGVWLPLISCKRARGRTRCTFFQAA